MKRIVTAALMLAGCGPAGAARDWTDAERAILLRLEWTGEPRIDPTNRVQSDPRAAKLGQALFFDPALSANGNVACASCHKPEQGFTDGQPVAEGLFTGRRNTPSIVSASLAPWLMWDGRKDSAWSQALGPIENPTEHGFSRLEAVRLLRSRYAAEYEAIFGALPAVDGADWPTRAMPVPADPEDEAHRAWLSLDEARRDAVNAAYANLGKAIAAYETKVAPARAPFDEYVLAVREGLDSEAISADARAGLRLFVGKAGCTGCHDGARLTDDGFHNLGLPADAEPDRGRSVGARQVLEDPFNCGGPYSDSRDDCRELRYLDPAFREFEGAFRTPSLRQVATTAPYTHAGRLATLADVIAFYSSLPGEASVGHREATLRPLALTEAEQRQLVAFLETLTGSPPDPALTRSP